MNQSASRPRLTRGAHDPKAHAYNIVGLFSQIIPLLAYLGRTLNDTMCDHETADICDRCQRKLYTVGTLISGSASLVAAWDPKRRAQLNARLAIAAARRLVDTAELGEPMDWAMKGGAVVTAARRAINAAAAVLNTPELGRVNEANAAARTAQELDLSTSRVARKHGLVAETYIVGFVLKAASKAAESAVAAWETTYAMPGEERELKLAKITEDAAGAALGAALDGAALLLGTGRAEAMMVVATGVCAEFDRLARPEDACEKSTSQKVTPGVSCSERTTVDGIGYPCVNQDEDHVEHMTAMGASWWTPEPAALPAWLTPTEEYDVIEDFTDSELGDVADEAIGDAAALAADLERAEAILNAVAKEHGAVETLVRTSREDGSNAAMVTEYYQECCVVCRDAKGRPVPAPCRTQRIIQGFGEL
jgi:hypothetical protein